MYSELHYVYVSAVTCYPASMFMGDTGSLAEGSIGLIAVW